MKASFYQYVIPVVAASLLAAWTPCHAESLEETLKKAAQQVGEELEKEENRETVEKLKKGLEEAAGNLKEEAADQIAPDKKEKVEDTDATSYNMSGPKVNAASLTEEAIEYKDGEDEMEGFAVYKTEGEATRPVVLIVHQWMGLTDYEKQRARQLAEMGYLAICVDIYGKGVRPADQAAAGELAGKYKGDRGLFRRRLLTGLSQAFAHPKADRSKVLAIGYCFGGTGVLELARTGAEVRGVVSFHGGLDSSSVENGENIRTKVLVCHGADDPFQKEEDLDVFEKEMRDNNVDWQLVKYGNAVHSFTQPMAGDDNSKGAAYNKLADRRSWKDMNQFFSEALK